MLWRPLGEHSRQYCLLCSPRGLHNTKRIHEKLITNSISEEGVVCTKCKQYKHKDLFYIYTSGKQMGKINSWCRSCTNEDRKAAFQRDRISALKAYSKGSPQCACCQIETLGFLGLDHINNDGAEHRRLVGRGQAFYRWLKRTHYAYPDLVVMCHNCNMARSFYGICPHKITNGDVSVLPSKQ